MKRRRNHRPEPRTQLLGLNLTEADLTQLNELFAAVTQTQSPDRTPGRLINMIQAPTRIRGVGRTPNERV